MALESFASLPSEHLRARLGFDPRLLTERVVARAAAVSRSYVGGLYPSAAPGIVRWIHSVAALRETLNPFGYEPDDTDQLSSALHPQLRIAIVPAAGNHRTGLPMHVARKQPSTKWPKGHGTVTAIARNTQLSMFEELEELPSSNRKNQIETWFLLQHATAEEVRSELSLPRFINSSGFITDWVERIILTPLDNSGGAIDEPFEDGDEGIDIVVEPK